jgi:hypothetical protein
MVRQVSSIVRASALRSRVNRHDYLAALFDDAGVRADSTSVDVQSQQTNYLAREEISKFFASVADGQERLDQKKAPRRSDARRWRSAPS